MTSYGEGIYGIGVYSVGSERIRSFIESSIVSKFPEIVNKDPDSVLRRYLDAHDEELEEFETDLNAVSDSNKVDLAFNEDIEHVGAIFGQIGRRRGRNDTNYKNYLQSIVESFSGRGTKPGIKFAIAGGLNTESENIEIIEHFDTLENSLVIKDWNAHRNETVVTLFNLAKPSVVQLRYPIRYETSDEGSTTMSGGVRAGNKSEGLSAGTIGDNHVGFYEEQQE